ncbi:response regulator [Almyronema epifaneia]|uniref:Response regulator n=1 Tax=Almyronema epifaneia S1 TaxID=2991925 RepID=A0ABW6IH90_9CYAN
MMPAPYILLVDDEPHNLLLLEELLAAEGYVTCSVASGMEALEQAQTQRPELILLDVMMPDMDGFEVCEQLRTNAALQTVPVIFLTALDDDASRLKGLAAMGDDYLTKPINADLMLTKIDSLLRLRQLQQAAYETKINQQVRAFQAAQVKSRQQMLAAQKINEALSEKFRLFVPDQFLQRVAPQGVESIELGNAIESEVTILFCDIRNFTAIAETQSAQETFTWLNTFFTLINQVVEACHGFIDKYLGDAVMVVFDRSHRHAVDGLTAVVKISQALVQLNQSPAVAELGSPIRIGMGLHTGSAVIGTIGASRRMDTTVVGDVVNTAARLEELTKTYACQAITSEAVVQQLPNNHPFQLRWVAQVAPRGKQAQIQLYEVLGMDETQQPY